MQLYMLTKRLSMHVILYDTLRHFQTVLTVLNVAHCVLSQVYDV